jgi:hypothetical protein
MTLCLSNLGHAFSRSEDLDVRARTRRRLETETKRCVHPCERPWLICTPGVHLPPENVQPRPRLTSACLRASSALLHDRKSFPPRCIDASACAGNNTGCVFPYGSSTVRIPWISYFARLLSPVRSCRRIIAVIPGRRSSGPGGPRGLLPWGSRRSVLAHSRIRLLIS